MIYEEIVDYCKRNKISICSFEKMCGIANGTIGRWNPLLDNPSEPSLSTLKKIEKYAGLQVSELINGKRLTYQGYVDLRDAVGITDTTVSMTTDIPKSTFSDWCSGRKETPTEISDTTSFIQKQSAMITDLVDAYCKLKQQYDCLLEKAIENGII